MSLNWFYKCSDATRWLTHNWTIGALLTKIDSGRSLRSLFLKSLASKAKEEKTAGKEKGTTDEIRLQAKAIDGKSGFSEIDTLSDILKAGRNLQDIQLRVHLKSIDV